MRKDGRKKNDHLQKSVVVIDGKRHLQKTRPKVIHDFKKTRNHFLGWQIDDRST
jgi:hypothetical protein